MRSPHRPEYKAMLRRLVAARHAAGLTQRDVARALKIDPATVSNIENGERRLDVIELRDLARLYHKPITYFVK